MPIFLSCLTWHRKALCRPVAGQCTRKLALRRIKFKYPRVLAFFGLTVALEFSCGGKFQTTSNCAAVCLLQTFLRSLVTGSLKRSMQTITRCTTCKLCRRDCLCRSQARCCSFLAFVFVQCSRASVLSVLIRRASYYPLPLLFLACPCSIGADSPVFGQ